MNYTKLSLFLFSILSMFLILGVVSATCNGYTSDGSGNPDPTGHFECYPTGIYNQECQNTFLKDWENWSIYIHQHPPYPWRRCC